MMRLHSSMLEPIILGEQISKKVFYARSHQVPKTEADLDETFDYSWNRMWPQFQERIYQFTSTFDYVVVTDIANYFDNVTLRQLRNVISAYGKIEGSLMDFLFFILEAFVWRPDYLPFSGVGLPQLQFDAPRLLAHGFLYEVDNHLNKSTKGNFVRWMDDIDFGVNSIEDAKRILKELDELLLTRGLRLNLGKTQILSSTDAKEYFFPDLNRFLTILTKRIKRMIKEKRIWMTKGTK
jgi:hypothetical protein